MKNRIEAQIFKNNKEEQVELRIDSEGDVIFFL